MSEAVAVERKIRVPPVLAFGSGFGKYQPETERDVRKVDVKPDEVLEQLKAAWKKVKMLRNCGKIDLDGTYNKALEQLKGIRYSANDVENFSIALVEFQDEEYFEFKTGLFLSALINNGKDADYAIQIQHLNQAIHHLGQRNIKNIVVNGDAGWCVGAVMKGGTIVVNGDASWGAGYEMEGGRITVAGGAGHEVGWEMKGGEIHVEGNYCRTSSCVQGGKIFHKGVLIVDK